MIVNQVANHPDFGAVYYSERASASLVALSVLEESFSVNQVKDNISGFGILPLLSKLSVSLSRVYVRPSHYPTTIIYQIAVGWTGVAFGLIA